MRFSKQSIAQVAMANDIYSVISPFVKLKRIGNDYLGLCPFHREKTPSFHVSTSKQIFHCFGCGTGGDVISFMMQINNLAFVDALKLLAEKGNVTLVEDQQTQEERSQRDTLLAIHSAVCELYHKAVKNAEGYVKERGLLPQTVETFKIGFAPNKWDFVLNALKSEYSEDELCLAGVCVKNEKGRVYDRFRNRLMFPITDVSGRCIGFGGRILGDEQPKYLNSPDTPIFNKGYNIFGINTAKNANTESIVLTEGYMDAVSLYQFGVKNVGAALGTAFTSYQAQLLNRYFKTVVLCYDSDQAGIKATMRSLEVLEKSELQTKIITLHNAKDPDEFVQKFGIDAFKSQVADAKTATQYRIAIEREKIDILKVDQRIEYVSRVSEILAKLNNAIEIDAHVCLLSQECEISVDAIYTEIKKKRSKLFKTDPTREILKNEYSPIAESKIPKNIELPDLNRRCDNAEADLLNLIFSDASVLNGIEDIDANFFDNPLHRQIFEKLSQQMSETGSVNLSVLDRALSEKAAAIFVRPLVYEKNIDAAKEIISYIKREKQRQSILNAGKIGNLDEVRDLALQL